MKGTTCIMLTYLFIILVVILLTDTKYVTSYNSHCPMLPWLLIYITTPRICKQI